MSTEHTNVPRSYLHTRVIGYEPPRTYHHVFITNHEPTRSWQHQTYHNAPCHYSIAYRSLSAARRNGSTNRLAVPHHRRALQLTRHPCFLLSPGGPFCTAMRHTSNVILLNLVTLIHFLAFTHSILKHPEINIHIHMFQLQHHNTYASFKYKHTFLCFIIHRYLPLKSIPTHTLFSPSHFPNPLHAYNSHTPLDTIKVIYLFHMPSQFPLHIRYDYHVPILPQNLSWSCNTRSYWYHQ